MFLTQCMLIMVGHFEVLKVSTHVFVGSIASFFFIVILWASMTFGIVSTISSTVPFFISGHLITPLEVLNFEYGPTFTGMPHMSWHLRRFIVSLHWLTCIVSWFFTFVTFIGLTPISCNLFPNFIIESVVRL